MEIEVLTQNVSKSLDKDSVVLNFGKIGFKGKAEMDVIAHGDFKEFSTEATCGCTVNSPTKLSEGRYKVNIVYKNTHIRGTFSKTILFKYDGNVQRIKIKGNVI